MDKNALLKSVPTGIWIGGEERKGSSTFDVLDPSDDTVLTSVANATAEDAIAALDAASTALEMGPPRGYDGAPHDCRAHGDRRRIQAGASNRDRHPSTRLAATRADTRK